MSFVVNGFYKIRQSEAIPYSRGATRLFFYSRLFAFILTRRSWRRRFAVKDFCFLDFSLYGVPACPGWEVENSSVRLNAESTREILAMAISLQYDIIEFPICALVFCSMDGFDGPGDVPGGKSTLHEEGFKSRVEAGPWRRFKIDRICGP